MLKTLLRLALCKGLYLLDRLLQTSSTHTLKERLRMLIHGQPMEFC